MLRIARLSALILCAGACAVSAPAAARDKMKVAAPHPTLLHTSPLQLAKSFGLFEKEDLDVEPLFTLGGADTLQAASTGSVDFALQTGIAGALSAIQQGAPLVIVANDFIGASEFFWYVRADKPFKSVADLGAGNTIGFSRPGASSETVLKALLDQAGSKAKLVPAGGPPENLVQVMSGQIDAGWSSPPLFKEFASGQVRILVRGNDAVKLRGMSSRVHVANANFAKANPGAVKRFIKAFEAAIDGLYNDPKVQAKAAELIKVDAAEVPKILQEFYPREAFTMTRIGDLDGAVALAIANKQMRGPLTAEQIAAIQKGIAEFTAR